MFREAMAWLIGGIWLSAVVGGFWVWEQYETAPGPVGTSTVANEAPVAENWRLTVFVHPRCPCTRATLTAAAELASAETKLSLRVLFVRPPDSHERWERGESWDLATQTAGAEVECDANGAEARRLGAKTSGHAVLTDPEGRIVFRGGLTQARGRQGESVGQRAVRDWVSGRVGATTAPAFGCPLFTQDDS